MDRGPKFEGEESVYESEYDRVNREIADIVVSSPNLDSEVLIKREFERRGITDLDWKSRMQDIHRIAWDLKQRPKPDYGSPLLRKSDVDPGTGYADRQIPKGDR